MCWQLAIPLLLSAGGAVMQKKANNDLIDRQRQIAADNILKQSQINRDADQRVAETVQQVASSNPNAEKEQQKAAYMDALRKALPTRAGAVPTNGNVSARFSKDAANAQAQTEAEAVQNADTTAAIEAPTYQRMNEGVDINNANVDLGLLRSKSASQNYLAQLRAAMQKPNQWLSAGGSLLSGAAGAYAAGGGFGNTDDVWNDGTLQSGMTAAQRRSAWMGRP